MREKIGLMVVLGVVGMWAALPAGAQAFEEEILVFRSVDDPALEDPSVEWCRSVAPEGVPIDLLPDAAIVRLGASLWSFQSRASDGVVVKEKIRKIGLADACGYLVEGIGPGKSGPFYMEGSVGGFEFVAAGECTFTASGIPVPGIVLTGCNLKVESDPSQGLLGGIATSNSVFNVGQVPGFQTGSFWTVHTYWE